MVRTLVVRGLIAGLIAGFAAGCFGFAFGEPRVDAAIAIEEASATHHHHDELVSRDDQRGGLFLATTLSGVALGALFALLFAAVRGRVEPRDPWSLAMRIGALIVVAVVLVPLVKYPPNPPAVGDPGTIGRRTALYVALLACSVLALLAAARAARAIGANRPRWARPLAGGLTFGVTIGVVMAVLPGVDEVPRTFPATLLWQFRLASAGTQLVLWLGLAFLFGLGTERVEARAAQRGVPA